jgi:hypothetical protein
MDVFEYISKKPILVRAEAAEAVVLALRSHWRFNGKYRQSCNAADCKTCGGCDYKTLGLALDTYNRIMGRRE